MGTETQLSGGLDAALEQMAATKCEFSHLNLIIELDSARLAPFEAAPWTGLLERFGSLELISYLESATRSWRNQFC
jgi:hypothetical protein